MLHLEELNNDNIWDVADLKVFRAQKSFVASNEWSIVQAYAVRNTPCKVFPFGIFKGKKPVGFIMIAYNVAASYDEPLEIHKDNYYIWRFMIDKRYQGRGYGREAMQLALDFIRTWPCGEAEYCSLSYEPENEVAAKLYRSFGFVETGDMDGGEVVAVLKL